MNILFLEDHFYARKQVKWCIEELEKELDIELNFDAVKTSEEAFDYPDKENVDLLLLDNHILPGSFQSIEHIPEFREAFSNAKLCMASAELHYPSEVGTDYAFVKGPRNWEHRCKNVIMRALKDLGLMT